MLVYGKNECLVMQMLLFVSCVHTVAVLNAAFCMTCSLLMLVEYARGILHNQSHDCLLLFTPSCCCECFYNL